jgi:hypothetical protein
MEEKLMPLLIRKAKENIDSLDIFYELEKSIVIESMPFGKMIYSKLDMVNIKLQPEIVVLIFLLTGNPGCIQLILKDILTMDKAKRKIKCHEKVTIYDVEDYKYFDTYYENKEDIILKELEPKWDAQKDYSLNNMTNNKCDTKEWWMEVYD